MVGTSKILTVSYGTFSCTLEGFDDPFSTMRSIAEYFRDLAAEDRYFGAEPPTPDLSHLHALAQNSNPHPVAAHVQDNGLRLTQSGPDDAAPASSEPVAQDASPSPVPASPSLSPAAATAQADSEEDDLALLLDGIDADDEPLEPGEDEDGNLFDVDASDAAEAAPAAKPAYDPRAAIAAKLAAAKAAVAREDEPRRVRAPKVSDEDLAAAAAKSPTRDTKRPEAFRDDLDSVNADATALSDEDEAELMAQLAALEDDSPDSPKGKDGKALLQSDLIEREDAALDRLLAKTNSKLTDTDVQQKHASLSHLKAAVAATMADRKSSDDHQTDQEDPDTAYRADLQKAVRPKAQADKPAPLVLVADRDAADKKKAAPRNADGSVRPRRVDAKPDLQARRDSDAGFSDYAEKVGARELNELMEAAAAYLNTVEGARSFTRPQVMHMVLRQERGKNFTREDSLRSFDALVRKGTITKVEHGQFVIRENSRYVS